MGIYEQTMKIVDANNKNESYKMALEYDKAMKGNEIFRQTMDIVRNNGSYSKPVENSGVTAAQQQNINRLQGLAERSANPRTAALNNGNPQSANADSSLNKGAYAQAANGRNGGGFGALDGRATSYIESLKARGNAKKSAAQNFLEATNPIAQIYRTGQAVEDIANTAINGKPAEPYEVGQYYINKANKARQDFTEQTGNNMLGQIALSAGDMAATAMTAGSLGVGLTPFMATSAGLQTAGEDINSGRGTGASIVHGALSGGITYLTEGLGGIGETALGQSIVSKLTSSPVIKKAIEQAPPQIAKLLGSSIVKFLANAGEEGLEEAIEYPAQALLENIMFDDDTPFSVRQWINNAVVGAGVGALYGGANLALSRFNAGNANANTNMRTMAENIAGQATQGGAGAQVAQNVAGNVQNVIPSGQNAQQNTANSQTIGNMENSPVLSGVVGNNSADAREQAAFDKIANDVTALQDKKQAAFDKIEEDFKPVQVKGLNSRIRRVLKATEGRLGVKIEYDKTLRGDNGYYDPNTRTIHIAADSADPIGVVLTHEITHRMKETSPELYENFKNIAFGIMQENGSFERVRNTVANTYADPNVIEDEMLAHFTRNIVEDIDSFEQLVGVNRNLAQKLYDYLSEIINKIAWDGDRIQDDLFGDMGYGQLQRTREAWHVMLDKADAAAQGSGVQQQSILVDQPNSADNAQTMHSKPLNIKPEIENLQKAYGTIEKGENPTYESWVPKESNTGKVSRFVRTFVESGHNSEDLDPYTQQAIIDGGLTYSPASNQKTIEYANGILERYGFEGAKAVFDENIDSKTSADEMRNALGLGERLIVEAANSGDTKALMDLVAKVAANGTAAGQAVQALSILKKMGPQGQLLTIQQVINKENRSRADIIKKNTEKNSLKIGELELQKRTANDIELDRINKEISKLKGEIYLPDSVVEDIMRQKTPKGLEEAVNRAYTTIGEQMTATWEDKWNAWRYLSMLGNARTHIRNIVGNSIMMPTVTIKDTMKLLLQKTPIYKGDNVTTFIVPKKIKEFALRDWAEIKNSVTRGDKYTAQSAIRDGMRIFNNPILEKARKLNSAALEAEDAYFLKYHYVRALGKYITANGGDFTNAEMVNKARTYAVNEAKKATFRDASAVADWINGIKRKAPKMARIPAEGVLPFVGTPINILRRGIEYSPIGVINSVYETARSVRDGSVTPEKALDDMCAGLTGSGIMALGMLLSSMGVLRGKSDDEKDSFDKLQGHQNYAIEAFGHSYTIDWATPISLPLFVGAEINRQMEKEEDWTVARGLDALSSIAEPVLNLSMLSGIQSIFNAVKHGDNALADLAAESVASYVSQGVPTLAGQVARTLDPVQKNAYFNDVNSGVPKSVQTFLNKNFAKIPFATTLLPDKVDAWGRKNESSRGAAALENFLSPGYYSKVEETPVSEMLNRLWEETGENVFPKTPPKYFVQDKETKYFTAEEYEKLSTIEGEIAQKELSELVGLSRFNSLTPEKQAKVVEEIYKQARAEAKSYFGYKLKGEAEKVYRYKNTRSYARYFTDKIASQK